MNLQLNNTPKVREIWRPVVGYEGLYSVSNLSRVMSMRRFVKHKNGGHTIYEKVLKLAINRRGYNFVGLYRNGKVKKCKVARLVAMAFIPNPLNKPEVNHMDGNKLNDEASNLEWNTHRENVEHAKANSLYSPPKGENNTHSKLKNDDVLMARYAYGREYQIRDIAKLIGLSYQGAADVCRGKRWKHLPLEVKELPKSKLEAFTKWAKIREEEL